MNSKLSDFNKKLIRQFLSFDGEMIRIGAKWREAESSIIKYQYVELLNLHLTVVLSLKFSPKQFLFSTVKKTLC